MVEVPDEPRSVAGHIALDFVNTAVYAGDDLAADVLRTGEALAAWCRTQAGLGSTAAPANLTATEHTATTGGLEQARALRAAVRTVVTALAHHETVPDAPLAVINEAYARALTAAAPGIGPDGLEWHWAPEARVHQLAAAAIDLLRDGRLDRIKECPGCGFLLYDTTRNGSRRWCAMEDCGTEEKSRRYVETRRQSRGQGKS
jgi:predicted RNA-binding Zn ribbon-like protein